MLGFVHDSPAPRVVFGAGALDRLPEEVDRLGATRVLILCTPGRGEAVERIAAGLGGRLAGVFDRARMHVPADVAEAARAEALRLRADCCVCIGGGSAIGLGKAVALTGGPPMLAIPTTYSGSEMTTIWGISAAGEKTTGRDARVLPRTVIYDPQLTRSLPGRVAGPSGINAVAHCVEALYAPDASPVTCLLAEQGIRALGGALPAVVRESDDPEARANALYGAWLAGSALGAASMGLHHRSCHVLGGSFDLPHAETHTVLLPYVAAFNQSGAPEAMARVAGALGATDAPGGLYDLATSVHAPRSLREIGMRRQDLDRAAALIAAKPGPNPRPVTVEGVRQLLEGAFHGHPPTHQKKP